MRRRTVSGLLLSVLAGSALVAFACRSKNSSTTTVYLPGSLVLHPLFGLKPPANVPWTLGEICPGVQSFLLTLDSAGTSGVGRHYLIDPGPPPRVAYLDRVAGTIAYSTTVAAPGFAPVRAELQGLNLPVTSIVPGPAAFNVICRGVADSSLPMGGITVGSAGPGQPTLTLDLPMLSVGAFNDLFAPNDVTLTYRHPAVSSLYPQSVSGQILDGGFIIAAGGFDHDRDETAFTGLPAHPYSQEVWEFDPRAIAFGTPTRVAQTLDTAMAGGSANALLDSGGNPFVVFAGGAGQESVTGAPYNLAKLQILARGQPELAEAMVAPRAFHAAEVVSDATGVFSLVLVGGCGIDGRTFGRKDWEIVGFPPRFQGVNGCSGVFISGTGDCGGSPPPTPSGGLQGELNHPECMMAHAVLDSAGAEGIWLGPATLPSAESFMTSMGPKMLPPNHPGREQYFLSFKNSGFAQQPPIPYPIDTGTMLPEGAWGSTAVRLAVPGAATQPILGVAQLDGSSGPYPIVTPPQVLFMQPTPSPAFMVFDDPGGSGLVPTAFQDLTNPLPYLAMPAVAEVAVPVADPTPSWLLAGGGGGTNDVAWQVTGYAGVGLPPRLTPLAPMLHHHAPGVKAARVWGSATWLNGSVLVVGGSPLGDGGPPPATGDLGWPELYVPSYPCPRSSLPPEIAVCDQGQAIDPRLLDH